MACRGASRADVNAFPLNHMDLFAKSPAPSSAADLGMIPNGAYLVAVRDQLELALRRGWVEFKDSPDWGKFVDTFERLGRAGFYEADIREWLPNPAYDNAARRICEPFRILAGQLGLSLMSDTPGDWSTSTELHIGEIDARVFLMLVYRNGTSVGALRLIFPHRHDRFDFPTPPSLEIVETKG